jgi:DNA methyltransferase 1-associated protein 1
MAASAADIRSALSLEPSASAGPSQSKRTGSSNVKKPEGISRELYSLIGPSAPTLAAQLSKPRLKQKPNLGIGTRTKW